MNGNLKILNFVVVIEDFVIIMHSRANKFLR